MSEDNRYIYFSFRNGRTYQVTEEQWEKEWLDWWNRHSKSLSSSEEEEDNS